MGAAALRPVPRVTGSSAADGRRPDCNDPVAYYCDLSPPRAMESQRQVTPSRRLTSATRVIVPVGRVVRGHHRKGETWACRRRRLRTADERMKCVLRGSGYSTAVCRPHRMVFLVPMQGISLYLQMQ